LFLTKINKVAIMPKVEKTAAGEATRQALIEAAARLFTRDGYAATSIRTIAAEAGITGGSVYNHFANKEEIFTAVILAYHPIMRVLPSLSRIEGQSSETLIREAANAVVAEMEKDPALFTLIAIELIEAKGQHLPLLLSQMMPHVQGFLERVYADGKIQAKDPMTFFSAFVGMLMGYGLLRYMSQRVEFLQSAKPSLEEHLKLFLAGVMKN
jgi:AcrR family transcriptional regulator